MSDEDDLEKLKEIQKQLALTKALLVTERIRQEQEARRKEAGR